MKLFARKAGIPSTGILKPGFGKQMAAETIIKSGRHGSNDKDKGFPAVPFDRRGFLELIFDIYPNGLPV